MTNIYFSLFLFFLVYFTTLLVIQIIQRRKFVCIK